ncbi:PP2C family protein-serine/threonine phosphatase [Microcoleus sp. AR_TQ3_B6]|uniref:PP2C family protein-serine/threonine phosphatase n=1 Tax=Microcoleus sp. AR_TQ3_B6 TaxID=3055284 RepID=UPI002FCF95A2
MDRKPLGIHLINLLSYPQKFTLIGFLFAIPLTLVMYLLISEINSGGYFAQKEIYGNQYLRPLRQLREYIPKLQLLNYQSLNPNLSNSESRTNLEAKIEANFQSLANTAPQLGNILMPREILNKTYQYWPNLKLRCTQWSLETYDFVYQRLAADMDRPVALFCHSYNLILDPDLDTYYLINATLLNLPEMPKILSEIRLIAQIISRPSDATPEERAQLITLRSRLREINEDLAINMELAFRNNHQGNLRLKLTQNLTNFNSQVKQLIKQLYKTIYQSILIKYDAYINGRNFAGNSFFNFWYQTVNNLDFSLPNTIKFFVKIRDLIDILLLTKRAIFIEFYGAIRQNLFVIDEASKKRAIANLCHNIILNNRDKQGQFVGAFKMIADALIGRNQKNTLLKDRLKAENMRMISELDLTRKIQQMLLPKDRELKEIIGLDIAGFMEGAEEVGGDYYHVLQHKGRVKIGMDDVTEHGWESGVLMIVVQTAFRTWLADNEPEPIKILSAINSVIYDSVQRLKFFKNASLALLDYQQGMLKLSGQHEERIVVRCNSCVEGLDTIDLGFQIGLDAEIADFFVETRVQLYSGDVVVLYTDGITEAENMDKLLYGLDRLIEVIEINWQRSAAEIMPAVIKDVRSHIDKQKVFDGITLLVLKQK